jgi:hypothetical protein
MLDMKKFINHKIGESCDSKGIHECNYHPDQGDGDNDDNNDDSAEW